MTEQLQEDKPVNIKDIIIDPETQIRLDFFFGIEELGASIKSEGINTAIELRRELDGLHLVAGRRRIEACRRIGKHEILPGEFKITTASRKETINHTITENLNRNNLSPVEEARAFKAAMDLDWGIGELAQEHGKTVQWIKDRLALLEAPQPVQDFIHQGKVGVETAKRAILDKPKEIQAAIAKAVVEDHLDVREAQQTGNRITAQYNDQKRFGELVAQSPFKTCPACKKPALPREHYADPSIGWAQCRENMYEISDQGKHIWNLKTGQTLAQKQATEQSANMKARAKERGGKKGPAIVTKAFRYNVPLEVIQRAVLAEAVAVAVKRLHKGSRDALEISVDDDFSITVEEMGDGIYFNLDDGGKFNKQLLTFGRAAIEDKKYNDRHGNLTKISPSQSSSNQDTINARNVKFRKWLDSLPEIAKYKKSHKL